MEKEIKKPIYKSYSWLQMKHIVDYLSENYPPSYKLMPVDIGSICTIVHHLAPIRGYELWSLCGSNQLIFVFKKIKQNSLQRDMEKLSHE